MSRGFHDSPHPPSLKAADKQMSWVVQRVPVWRRQQIKAALIALSQHKQNGDDATLTRSVAAPTFAYFISIHLNVPPPTIPPTTTTTSHLSGDGAYHGTGPGRWLLLPQFYNEKSANLKKKKNTHSAVFVWVRVFFLPLLVNSPSGDLTGVRERRLNERDFHRATYCIFHISATSSTCFAEANRPFLNVRPSVG